MYVGRYSYFVQCTLDYVVTWSREAEVGVAYADQPLRRVRVRTLLCMHMIPKQLYDYLTYTYMTYMSWLRALSCASYSAQNRNTLVPIGPVSFDDKSICVLFGQMLTATLRVVRYLVSRDWNGLVSCLYF